MCSYSFTLLFLDLWSVIPILVLYILNLALCGVFFTKIEDNIREKKTSKKENTIENANDFDDLKSKTQDEEFDIDQIGWNKSLAILSPKKEMPDIINDSALHNIENINTSKDSISTPRIINEDNTPIFLNSVAGLFFPACHTKALKTNDVYEEDLSLMKILNWQKRFYRIQVVLLNSVILTVLSVIYILITSVDTFNYSSNVLDIFWFKFASVFLGSMGIFTLITSTEMDIFRLFHKLYKITSFFKKKSPECVTVEENKEHSVKLDIDDVGRGDPCKKTYFCLISTLLIFSPAIAGLVLYELSDRPEPVVFFIDGETPEIVMLGAVQLPDIPTINYDKISGNLSSDCHISENHTDKILVINMTDPVCAKEITKPDFIDNVVNSEAKSLIILDNTPEKSWRVSSPYRILQNQRQSWGKSLTCPVLILRQSDWEKFSVWFNDHKKLYISSKRIVEWDNLDLFSCTQSPDVQVKNRQNMEMINNEECSEKRGKHLYEGGILSENLCVKKTCSFHGKKCVWQTSSQIQISAKCKNVKSSPAKLWEEPPLQLFPRPPVTPVSSLTLPL